VATYAIMMIYRYRLFWFNLHCIYISRTEINRDYILFAIVNFPEISIIIAQTADLPKKSERNRTSPYDISLFFPDRYIHEFFQMISYWFLVLQFVSLRCNYWKEDTHYKNFSQLLRSLNAIVNKLQIISEFFRRNVENLYYIECAYLILNASFENFKRWM